MGLADLNGPQTTIAVYTETDWQLRLIWEYYHLAKNGYFG